MKKGLLIILVLLLLTLSSCASRKKLFKNFDTQYETPLHYVIGYGTETHFEYGGVIPEIYMVYHDGKIHYDYMGYIYIPLEDGTYDIIDTNDRPKKSYNMSLEFEFLELSIDEFDQLLSGKRYRKGIFSSRYKYDDDTVKIDIHNSDYDQLHYDIVYKGQEIMYSITTIRETEYVIPYYEPNDTTGNIFSSEYTLEIIENSNDRYNIFLNNNRISVNFKDQTVYFYLGSIIEYDLVNGGLTNLTNDDYYIRDTINEYYGSGDELFWHLDRMYTAYRRIIYGENEED